MAAILRLGADPADVRRAFGGLVGDARKINSQLNRDAKAAAAERVKTLRQEQTEHARSANASVRAREKAERDATKATISESKKRERAESSALAGAKRTRDAYYRELEQKEVRATRVVEREALARTRASERSVRAIQNGAGRALAGAATMGVSAAGTVNGMVQGARERRAGTDRTLNQALYQAGAGRDAAVGDRARVHAFALANRMDSAALAGGLNVMQTEFSSLGNSRTTDRDRTANLDRAMQTALLARDTGQDVGEVMRVSGLLENSGIRGPQNRAALLGLTGMAQRGAIELRSVSREAMAPMMARMHQAQQSLMQRNPHATEAEQSEAQRAAAMQSFAEIEVARGQGATPRRFSNVMRQLGTELQGSHRQSMLLGNINNSHDLSDAQRTQLRSMFDNGHLREQFQSGLGFASRVHEITGGNEALMRNVFTGGGHGNPMGLQTNWRDAVAMMGSGNSEVNRMVRGVGRDFTETDVQRGSLLFGGDDQSSLTKNQEEREQALVGNTSALTELSNRFTAWSSSNPITAALGGSTVAALLPQLAKLGGGGAILPTIARVGATAAGAAGAGAMTLAGLVGGIAGGGIGTGIVHTMNRMTERGSGTSEGNEITLFNIVRNAIMEGMRSTTVVATVDPHDAAHAANAAAMPATRAVP